MEILKIITAVVSLILTVCYAYQFLYIPIALWGGRKRKPAHGVPHSFAVMICARNEGEVIGDLIASIKHQTYDGSLIKIFVLADNCTDDTEEKARSAGATVYRRRNLRLVGKGYALGELMGHIRRDHPEGFDGYFVFDADNILAEDYIERMNETFSNGHALVTGYRNSKNYGDNWISAGYSLGFMRECRYMNGARAVLGASSFVSGTGFLFSREIADEMGGWRFHTLTEDKEFTIYQILKGRRVAYCPDAELFDEQPLTFAQSWRQRQRWAKGFLQVFGKYGARLAKNAMRGDISSYDILMAVFPSFVLSAVTIIGNTALALATAANVGTALVRIALGLYTSLFFVGALTTCTEWRRIHTTTAKKLWYTVTFPVFSFTFIPVALSAIFARPQWRPIHHTVSAKRMSKDNIAAMRLGKTA